MSLANVEFPVNLKNVPSDSHTHHDGRHPEILAYFAENMGLYVGDALDHIMEELLGWLRSGEQVGAMVLKCRAGRHRSVVLMVCIVIWLRSFGVRAAMLMPSRDRKHPRRLCWCDACNSLVTVPPETASNIETCFDESAIWVEES